MLGTNSYVGYPTLLWGNNTPKQEMACIKVVNYNKNNKNKIKKYSARFLL
jgi:hypothetical protein